MTRVFGSDYVLIKLVTSPYDQSFKLKGRNNFEITAKLFYLSSSSTSADNPSIPPPSYISQSLHHLFCLLGITYIDSFIVYFNGLLFDDQDQDDSYLVMDDFEALVEVWKELEFHYRNDRIKNWAKMISYAKEHDIELLTHKDPTDILPSTTFQKILKDTKFPFTSELLPRWVLKYSVLVKCREVVANKE
ncbi:hypothetical protein C2G38_2194849 [Gigaspora rosea]|uniref:Uncharacterized protein n=1 Tax=Gigaspora rosea TaxID=44941 RepID=A0A397UXU4_9GLOM|nr:hypothetical protein C2G38_2194849 [Gigaspora rosea]